MVANRSVTRALEIGLMAGAVRVNRQVSAIFKPGTTARRAGESRAWAGQQRVMFLDKGHKINGCDRKLRINSNANSGHLARQMAMSNAVYIHNIQAFYGLNDQTRWLNE